MAQNHSTYPYPEDEFDRAAATLTNVGAHRAEEPFWQRNLVPILVALAALLVLAFLFMFWGGGGTGAGGSEATTSAEQTTSAPAEESPAEAPPPDMSIPVQVFNGAEIDGLAGSYRDFLEDQGFTVGNIANGGESYEQNTVLYREEEQLPTAQAVADAIGAGEPQQSDEYEAPITVIAKVEIGQGEGGEDDEG